ncbi:MAG: sigma-70 family RNA polymerase sigma factor [Pirellulales bacterium]
MSLGQNRPVDRAARIAELIDEARAGSASKLGELLERTRRYLLLVANGSLDGELRRKQAASDLVQETFLQAQRHFADFRGQSEEELVAWLLRILENKTTDLTRRFLLAEMRDARQEVPLEGDGRHQPPELAAPDHSPRALAIAREQSSHVECALARVPREYAEVIRLRSIERLDFAAVGRKLGNRSADAARKLWLRAIAQLQRELMTDDDSG